MNKQEEPIVLTPESKEAIEKGREEIDRGDFESFDSVEEIEVKLRQPK